MKKDNNYNKIMKNLRKNIKFCDIILMHCFKKYTLRVYRLGLQDGFNWNNNKNVGKIEKIKIEESE